MYGFRQHGEAAEIVKGFMRKAYGLVVLFAEFLDKQPCFVCGVEYDAAVHLSCQAAYMHQPSLKAYFIFGMTGNHNVDASDGIDGTCAVGYDDLT